MSTCVFMFFFFKQKTAYEMRISDWSSDVCSSDLRLRLIQPGYSGTALKRALAGSQTPGYNAGMSSTIWMLLAAAGVMAASCAATGLVLPLLRRRAVLDHPKERSSHAVPTPRGGGHAEVGRAPSGNPRT